MICIYHSFRPQDYTTPTAFFETQLGIIKNALTSNTYLLGDFNLDARMEMRDDYDRKIPLSSLVNFALENNLIQMVNETTWSRTINGIRKESLLDHVYLNNPASVLNVFNNTPLFGDHSLVLVELTFKPHAEVKSLLKRNWNNYDVGGLNLRMAAELSLVNYKCDLLSVQDQWSMLENVFINVIDIFAPLTSAIFKIKPLKTTAPPCIKHKINRRKKLIRSVRSVNSVTNSSEIRILNKEIRDYFVGVKISNIKRAGLGVGANLWKAVKLAKNLTTNDLPSNLTLGGNPVAGCNVANSFAKHFNDKIKLNASKIKVDPNGVYNGKCKLIVQNRNFMQKSDISECIFDLPNKKCEGFDRIPVCALRDCGNLLLDPMYALFSSIVGLFFNINLF